MELGDYDQSDYADGANAAGNRSAGDLGVWSVCTHVMPIIKMKVRSSFCGVPVFRCQSMGIGLITGVSPNHIRVNAVCYTPRPRGQNL